MHTVDWSADQRTTLLFLMRAARSLPLSRWLEPNAHAPARIGAAAYIHNALCPIDRMSTQCCTHMPALFTGSSIKQTTHTKHFAHLNNQLQIPNRNCTAESLMYKRGRGLSQAPPSLVAVGSLMAAAWQASALRPLLNPLAAL